jgi:repressor of nif and glnA expression
MDGLDKAQLLSWDAAIDYYKTKLSPKDVVFDEELIKVTRSLANGSKETPVELRAVLDRAAPVYRQVW